MRSTTLASRRRGERRRVTQAIGRNVPRFQEASHAFDDVAAEVLALSRSDLPIMTMLLFGGPASADDLSAALHIRRSLVTTTFERLQLAGYARFQPQGGSVLELTAHAKEWIERIWAPLRQDGAQLFQRYSTPQLAAIASFLENACAIQESRLAKLRAWLATPSSPARRSHLRGGLSPAAIQRVSVFVAANLGAAIHLHDLAARAALSPYHFARAFKTSVGSTPRTFVEQRRVDQAKRLLAESDQPIASIAADTGFGTQSRLTTVFRRHTGFTPAAYRRGRG
jgi:AraC family transcriptional regulator